MKVKAANALDVWPARWHEATHGNVKNSKPPNHAGTSGDRAPRCPTIFPLGLAAFLLTPIPGLLNVGVARAGTENFATPLEATWASPRTPLRGSTVSIPVDDTSAEDGRIMELLYPGGTNSRLEGPRYATQLCTAEPTGYGAYATRAQPAAGSQVVGIVSAFFTYFNDGSDHDGDGLVDNHEIDIEFLAAEPSMLYLTVWTEYQADESGESFRKVTRRIDLRTGSVWGTPPGGEAVYDLIELDPLPWNKPDFMASTAYYIYGFDWQPTEVAFWVDLEDGVGRRDIWTLRGAANETIPSISGPLCLNLWHNANHWDTGQPARPPIRDAVFRVDRVTLP